MEFIKLDILLLEIIIPSYLNLRDKVNYFRALNKFTPERFFIKQVLQNKKEGLTKKKLFNDLYFIKYNLFILSNKCMQILKYQHWLYISAFMPIKKHFIIKYKNKLIVSALVNNFNCFKKIHLWSLDYNNLNTSYKVFNCWGCNKKFTTYRNKKIKTQYYLHNCYINLFQYSRILKTIKHFYLIYIYHSLRTNLLKQYA